MTAPIALRDAITHQTGTWSIMDRSAGNSSPRERILSAAAYLFCHEGFAATGVDAIVARAGAAKTTLYKHFASKELLIDAVLEREGEAWRRWFFCRLGQIQGAPRERLLGLFDVLEEWFEDPNFYGCPFINAISEFATSNERIRAAAKTHKSHLTNWLHATALEMNAAAPEQTARAMVVLIDGAIVAAQASRDPSFAVVARDLADAHISHQAPELIASI